MNKTTRRRSISPEVLLWSACARTTLSLLSKTDTVMKTRGAYKKRPGSNGMPHFNRERSRPRIDEDFLAMERMTRPGAHIYWGSETRADGSSPSKFVRDKTWGLTFQHFSQVDTDFSIKAGSKKMLLTSAPIMSSADPSKVVKISESWLHKKYR